MVTQSHYQENRLGTDNVHFSPSPLDICKWDKMDYDQDICLNTTGKTYDHTDRSLDGKTS